MKLIDYIDFIIKSLFEKFPNLSECSYYFDKCSETHFICINDPNILSTETFCAFDSEITTGFYDLSLQGSICFISDHSIFSADKFEKQKNPFIVNNTEEFIFQYDSLKLNQKIQYSSGYLHSFDFNQDIPVDPEVKYKLAA
jgi:hypothetical protein